jgi:hypothetical protein
VRPRAGTTALIRYDYPVPSVGRCQAMLDFSGALGVVLLLIGAYRAHRVRAALVADRPLPMDAWTVWLLTVAGLVLAAATLVMLVAEM